MRDVFVIKDLDTLRVVAEPTRVAIIELLTEPRSVTELAEALGVPRTRLYHHIDLLLSHGLIQVVEERTARAQTERVYRLTARTYRPSARLLSTGDLEERLDAISTLFFDASKSDFRRAVKSGEASLDEPKGRRHLKLGRSVVHLSPVKAEEFIAEIAALADRLDDADEKSPDARPYSFTWAFYPASGRVR